MVLQEPVGEAEQPESDAEEDVDMEDFVDSGLPEEDTAAVDTVQDEQGVTGGRG